MFAEKCIHCWHQSFNLFTTQQKWYSLSVSEDLEMNSVKFQIALRRYLHVHNLYFVDELWFV
jgi:hypothetical protein